jgi:hypothetical protein
VKIVDADTVDFGDLWGRDRHFNVTAAARRPLGLHQVETRGAATVLNTRFVETAKAYLTSESGTTRQESGSFAKIRGR